MKLPKLLESEKEAPRLTSWIQRPTQVLVEGEFKVPSVRAVSPELDKALGFARRMGGVTRGLEAIEVQLQSEEAGLVARVRKGDLSGIGDRINRLLLVSSDGSDRLYRQCHGLVEHYTPRLLCIHFALTSQEMGKWFGADEVAKVLLVHKKEAVVRVLKAMLPVDMAAKKT